MALNNNEPLQLGLLPNFDMPMRLLRQRPTKASRSLQKPVLAIATQQQLELEPITGKTAKNEQSYPDPTTLQLLSEWERSQEFEINVALQSVRVNFRAFYFSRSMFGCGVHHFEFFGHSTSPTGYRSDFLQASLTASWSSPTAYAQQRAQELHGELLKQQHKQLHSY